MALLQLLAAQLAGVDRLVFHSGDGLDHIAEATELLEELPMKQGTLLAKVVDMIHQRRFTWGVSDGD